MRQRIPSRVAACAILLVVGAHSASRQPAEATVAETCGTWLHLTAEENKVVERADGVLVMYIRTGAGVIWQSLSEDRGRTQSPGEPTKIANPGSRFSIRRGPSERLPPREPPMTAVGSETP